MTFGLMMSICRNRNGSHGVDFVGLGIAVLRRPALDDVRDVDVVARQLDRLDDLRQQLAGAADKRHALLVFVGAGRLADEHQVGRWVADAEDDLLRPSVCSLQRVQSPMSARIAISAFRQHCERRPRDQRPAAPAARTAVPSATLPAAVCSLRLRHAGVAAHAGHAELGGERQMFGQLIAIHGSAC